MAFPVTDLDAYERRMRWRARLEGIGLIGLGVVFWTAGSHGPTGWSASFAILIGSLLGMALWTARRRWLTSFFADPDPPRGLRKARTWVILLISACVALALYLVAKVVFDRFDVDLSIGAFGATIWAAVGVAAILEAPRWKQRRERYEADLREIAAGPARPDINPS